MIDIDYAKKEFKKFLEKYRNEDHVGFELKVIHTYHVVEAAKDIATRLNLSEEDIALAELIGLLHDIGRFEELNVTRKFDSVKFDHASYGVKMLFEDDMIRDFIKTDEYDEIIRKAIGNHSLLKIEDGLGERELLHAKIIRDADKLDNFRVKYEEKVETIFPGTMKSREELETASLSDAVYETVKEQRCVNIHDRKTILDYWVCVLAFIFDLNFEESYEIVKDNDYMNLLIDRFSYKDEETTEKMEEIRDIINGYIESKLERRPKTR